ncbi:MAG: hypothetical protein E4H11_01665 [Myxococcales bacterium]|nr:MAG: hypothetical protein E4H11_01665 [Myxococcales bacterium]
MTDGASQRGTETFANALGPEALRALVAEFVARERTDDGVVERSVEERIAQVTTHIVVTRDLLGLGAP